MVPIEFKEKNCLLYKNLDLIGKKWSIFILLYLWSNKDKKVRFNEILAVLPSVTSRALSLRLKLLEDSNIIVNEIELINNLKISKYSLSEGGKELLPIVIEFKKWGEKYGICLAKENCNRCDFIYELEK